MSRRSAARDITEPSGAHIRYYEAGDSGASPMVLHGSGPGATGWSNVSGNFGSAAAAGFHLIAPDMSGWGSGRHHRH